jgi:hypothetical protein
MSTTAETKKARSERLAGITSSSYNRPREDGSTPGKPDNWIGLEYLVKNSDCYLIVSECDASPRKRRKGRPFEGE